MEKKWTEIAIARAIGVTRETLRSYRYRGCTGKTPEEVAAWREENIEAGRPSLGERSSGSYRESQDLDTREQLAKIACKEAEAAKREIENKILLGELGRRDVYEQGASELVNLIRARLEMLPDQITADAPSEIRSQERERIADTVHLILMEMSQWKLTTEE